MQKYDNYKKSSIQWIGETPGHWNYKRFKYCFDLISEKSQTDLPKIGLENIESWTGKYLKTSTEFEGDGEVFEVNDILFGKLRPYLAKVLLASFSGKAVGDIFVFRSKDEIIPGYGHKLILSKPFIEITNSSTFGSKMPRVSWEFISDLEIPIPTKPEQTQIANYLDRKTTEIDNLIADKKALVELYKEEKTAIINQAVTKGINPEVKMKDSGIEWLGKIPEHWEVKKLKYVAKMLSGNAFSSKDFCESGVQLLKISNLYNNQLSLDRQPTFLPEEFQEKYANWIVKSGDILMSMTGTLGKRDYGFAILIENTSTEFLLNQRVSKIYSFNQIHSKLLLSILHSEYFLNSLFSKPSGTKQGNFSNEDVLNLKMVYPKAESEQQQIVQFIEIESERIDNEVNKAEKYITLLTEYKSALISEVVTGKIKVTEA